ISIIALLVIFQPEIRQGLARLGQRYPFKLILKREHLESVLKEIIVAVDHLQKKKVGALIAISRNDSLKPYIDTGIMIDAFVSSDLIETIFTTGSPLHDGGLIIQNDRIVAGGCIFPLTEDINLSRIYGMRHRAGIGLTESTDAIVIIVSEERSEISLVYQGKLFQNLNREELLLKIKDILKV
ncbi:MAG: DNA integrity scanning protein DisA nucleotide-binding domain protein, partial [Candidatus Omnitrophica bacterium]|nr:DNA integrity scanning protein DisA nucleotide-binding domain protein [Candidatus Omnitrophota bacterium]